MEPLTHAGVAGGVLLAALVLLAAVAAVLLTRSARARRAQVTARLEESRDEVARLSRRVEELSAEVLRTRQAAAAQRAPTAQEYVITSLVHAEGAGPSSAPSLGRVLEDQLVGSLARHQGGAPLRTRAVDLVVQAVSLGHGVRRALSPDNLDRAAAEANVARRRSRRTRKRELREARRLLRVVRASSDRDVA